MPVGWTRPADSWWHPVGSPWVARLVVPHRVEDLPWAEEAIQIQVEEAIQPQVEEAIQLQVAVAIQL